MFARHGPLECTERTLCVEWLCASQPKAQPPESCRDFVAQPILYQTTSLRTHRSQLATLPRATSPKSLSRKGIFSIPCTRSKARYLLRYRASVFWSAWRDSNSRPLAPHASALPGCATRRQAADYSPRAAAALRQRSVRGRKQVADFEAARAAPAAVSATRHRAPLAGGATVLEILAKVESSTSMTSTPSSMTSPARRLSRSTCTSLLQLVARAADREALLVQQLADAADQQHLVVLVVAPVAAPLHRLAAA